MRWKIVIRISRNSYKSRKIKKRKMGQSEEDYFFFVYECLYVCWSFFFMLYTVDWYHLTSLVIFRVPEIRVYQVLWDILFWWPDPSLGIIQLLYLIFLHMFKNCITTCVLYRIWVKKQITLLFFVISVYMIIVKKGPYHLLH